MSQNLDLFASVVSAYVQNSAPLKNEELYQFVAKEHALNDGDFAPTPIGKDAKPASLLKRKIRWHQQTLKHANVIQSVPGKRGTWALADLDGPQELKQIAPGLSLLGFSTELGIAVVSTCETFFARFDQPIHLIITSPPFPLAKPRKYGNPSLKDYVQWVVKTLEPVIKHLVPGGSICINVGNEIFVPGTPARSLYRERLILELCDQFGLYKMDEIIWEANKPPGPVQWASNSRVQLHCGYEPVYWLTNNPDKVFSNNQRVLQPHTDKHLAFVRSGGAKKSVVNSDGAYRIRQGSYGKETAGRIPRNIQKFSMSRADMNKEYRAYCEENGLQRHGASMPISLAKFLVEFLSERGHMVADPLGGRLKVGMACEELGRNWVSTDRVFDYVAGSAPCFGKTASWMLPH
ncbi:DNA methyltransferase [Eoetvoesiella caeni]